MSDPINKMFPSGGGMRGGPALVCVTYDSNGNPCGISGLPDFAENYVEALVAERERLAAENARLRDAVALIRTELNTQINGGTGWMARFEEIVKGDAND